MIAKEQWEKLEQLKSAANTIEDEIESHMTEVIRAYIEIYNGKLNTWYYPDAPEGGMGTMRCNFGTIDIILELKKGIDRDIKYITHDGEGCDLTCDFPQEFLFMSVKDVTSLLRQEREDYILEEESLKVKRKEQREARKVKKAALKESAKKKLTPEEAKALGIK